MSGRRSYQRYGVTNADGYLRIVRDVTLWRGVEHEFIVVSDDPESSGELLTLEHVVNGTAITVEVCVIDSHPAIVNGRVRHQLRLKSHAANQDRQSRAVKRAH
jgi:hypothetical protein